MNELEEHAIAKARQELGIENVYNLKSGGLNHIHSDESRRKMSEARTGKTHSEETKKKMSDAKTGENHPMFGKPGINLGKTPSDETRRKMSEAHSGENNHMFGKPIHKNKTWSVINGKRVWSN